MPKCQKCFGLFPPQFSVLVSEEDHICIYCRDNIDYIMYDDENGERKKYTKEECKRDYEKYLKMIKERNEELLEEKRLSLKE